MFFCFFFFEKRRCFLPLAFADLLSKALRPALAGAAATCAANGIARFAYVPLFPAMVVGGWVDGGQAGVLGAMALAGYLVGTLGGRTVALRVGVPATLDVGMALVVLAMAACAWNGGFLWFLVWRGMAGVAGGLLMALAGPASQASVPANRRGTAGGLVIAGVGVGIVVGALIVPALLPAGLPAAWLGLAGLVLGLWVLARPHWPDMALGAGEALAPPPALLLLLTYGLFSAGMVPPMVYLSDLAARGHGLGVTAGAVVWVLFGLGGIVGGLSSGRVVDAIGGRRTLVAWLAMQTAALGLAMLPAAWLMLPVSLFAGFAGVGVSAVTLAVTREIAPLQPAGLWVRATAIFGVVQTGVAFAMAWLFAWSGQSHLAVFGAGLAFSVLATLAAVAMVREGKK
jgi:predicted MFS family arabinose efflux permease